MPQRHLIQTIVFNQLDFWRGARGRDSLKKRNILSFPPRFSDKGWAECLFPTLTPKPPGGPGGDIRHRESFLDCPVPNGFPRVLVLHPKCFQSGKELIGMKGASYSRCKVDLCSFTGAFFYSFKVLDEAQV